MLIQCLHCLTIQLSFYDTKLEVPHLHNLFDQFYWKKLFTCPKRTTIDTPILDFFVLKSKETLLFSLRQNHAFLLLRPKYPTQNDEVVNANLIEK